METVAVAQEAVPLKIFEATADAPVEQFSVPKRKIQKRKRMLVLETDDEINVEKQPAVENLDEQVGGPADDSIDEGTIIGNVASVDDTESSEKEPVDEPVAGQQEVVPVVEASTDDPDVIIEQDLMAQLDAERPVVTASDTDEEMEQVDVFTEINTAWRIVGTDADAETMDFGTGVRDQQAQTFVGDPTDEEMSGDGEQAVDERIDADEAMSLEDIILSIPVDVPLPSTGVEITKITMGKEIKIPGVDERTWHLASLPQIKVDDKGKEPLKQKDPIKGRPHLEHYSLICADIDLLVKLRAQVIDEVDQFFNSFSLKKLATINVEDMTKQVLLGISRVDPSSSSTERVIAMLSDLHLFVLVELKEQAIAHGLTWTKTCCSKIFEGHTRDRGAVIARNNTSTPSKCWIRTMIHVDGVWAVEPCADHWVKIPRLVVLNEFPRQCSYVDTLPTVSEFFKIMTKIWADVCLEVVEFCVSGKLLPVGSINLCRSLPVAQPVFSVSPRQPTVLALRISQFCTVFLDYSLFSRMPTVDITSFVASISSERTVLRSVQILSSSAVSPRIPSVSSTDFVAQRIPLVVDQHSFSSSSSDASMHFDDHDTANTAFSRPVAATPDVTEALAQLQASIDQIRARDGDANLKDILLMHLHGIEQRLTACLDDQDRVLGALLDVRRVVKELEAKVIYLDEKVAATRNDLLEFSAQAQQTLNIITEQLSELVAHINRGGNNKKGEVVSSSRPQPPPNDQNRDSGIAGGGGDTDRSVVERLLSADRQRQR
ncbi:protein DYAD-like [Dorcoceras hygrometricum]|uniref:Protein DYAD-like n=1 Tax=Dorcoceras hygrometricum TaxID=472368 RepID=A0A2Z7B940_9LAMI|nr:protein DYAD-like [Dorcoceras hygrometricum]